MRRLLLPLLLATLLIACESDPLAPPGPQPQTPQMFSVRQVSSGTALVEWSALPDTTATRTLFAEKALARTRCLPP